VSTLAEKLDSAEAVRTYHRLSKHRIDRFAPGPGRLDWETQPDPFRRFAGAPKTDLPLRADRLRTRFSALRCSHGVAPHPIDLERVGVLFQLSLGLSAWKRYRSTRWSLRCNPSSGNLHPTEGYLVCPGLPGIAPGVHHYLAHEHVLEHRARCDGVRWSEVFAHSGFMIAFTSIFWREAWKYGVRAYRYCQHDVGHALAAVRYAAAALGWRAHLLDGWGDDDVARLLGIHRPADFRGAEHESPDAVLWVGPRERAPEPDDVLGAMAMPRWFGRANRLSPKRVAWPPIDEVEKVARKRRTDPTRAADSDLPPLRRPGGDDPPASRLIVQRRSAVDLDGETSISRTRFFEMLDALLPRPGVAPWDALPWAPRVHPVFFVHRVDGLVPGIYALPRGPEAIDVLRNAMRKELLWEPVEGAAPIDLRLLVPIDARETAATIACGQAIAADGAFSVGMLAELDRSLDEGAWWYRHLHWEAGVLGHVLYLEAERVGIRGTGIGCFFDDTMHDLLGVSDWAVQTLYHFTAGGPLDDPRLQSEPPYAHLDGADQSGSPRDEGTMRRPTAPTATAAPKYSGSSHGATPKSSSDSGK
jgi:SagB-type dehydrogenase family enzyme